jgi:serine/threonine-protein kinase
MMEVLAGDGTAARSEAEPSVSGSGCERERIGIGRREAMTGPEITLAADELLARRELLREEGVDITLEALCEGVAPAVRDEVARRLDDVLAAERAFETTWTWPRGSAAGVPFVPAGVADRYVAPSVRVEGGMGMLCVCEDVELGRRVAYKVMKRDRARDPVARALFFNEAEITARLAHPGIVPVFGRVIDDSGLPAYACELVTGQTLGTMIARYHAISPADRSARAEARAGLLRSFIATCQIVAYAHSKHVVHCDIKPSNVMIDEYGATRLVDWGVARVLEHAPGADPDPGEDSDLPRPGTFWYMSRPYGPASYASDIYSLGLTLGYILAEPNNDQRDPFLPAGDTQPALWAIVEKATHRVRAARYASAEFLARDVQDVLDDKPVAAYRDPLPTVLRRWAGRHGPAVASAVALLLVAAIAGPIVGARERQLRNRADGERLRVLRLTEEMLDQADHVGKLQATLPGSKALLGRAVQLVEQLARDHESEAIDPGPVAGNYYRAGRIYQNLNQLDEAARCYQHSTLLAERRFGAASSDLANRNLWAAGLRDWGVTLVAQGRTDEAARAWARALAVLDPVSRASPAHRLTLARVHYAIGNLAMMSRDQKKAQDSFGTAQTLAAQLVDEAGDEPGYLRALADIENNQGMSLQMEAMPEGHGVVAPAKLATATEMHRKALELRRRLSRLEPGKPENLADVAASLNHLGNVSQLSGAPHFADAEAYYLEARTMLEALVLAFPGVPSNRREVAEIYANLNALYIRQNRRAEAQALARAAVELFTRLVSEYPDTPDLHVDLGIALGRLAESLPPRGNPAEPAARRYESAVAFARASRLTREPKRREELAKRAIAILNTLKTGGYFQVSSHATALGQEDAFTHLRERRDFPAL